MTVMSIQGTVIIETLHQPFHLALKQYKKQVVFMLLTSTLRRMIQSFIFIFILDKWKLLKLRNNKQPAQDNLSKEYVQDFNADYPTPVLNSL